MSYTSFYIAREENKYIELLPAPLLREQDKLVFMLKEWTTASAIQIRLLSPKTWQDDKMFEKSYKMDLQSYYYAISNVRIAARCATEHSTMPSTTFILYYIDNPLTIGSHTCAV